MDLGNNARADLPLAVVISAGGMGMAAARRLGHTNRLLLADRDEERLGAAAEALRREGHHVAVAACDVTVVESVRDLARAAAARGPVKSVVHVAGLSPSMGDWRAIMSVDLIGAVLMADAMLGVASEGTAAIFISSIAGHGEPPSADVVALLDDPLREDFLDKLAVAVGAEMNSGLAYSLAKWSVIRLCRRRAGAWGAKGARILSISPGLIASPQGALETERQPAKKMMLAKTPLAREGSLLEVAEAIGFLGSDKASFITGTDILVDGGVSAALRFAG